MFFRRFCRCKEKSGKTERFGGIYVFRIIVGKNNCSGVLFFCSAILIKNIGSGFAKCIISDV